MKKLCVNCNKEEINQNSTILCSNESCHKEYFTRFNNNIGNCIICEKELSIKQMKNKQKTCSRKCGRKSCENTCEERYGYSYTLQNPEFLKKKNDTCIERYQTKNTAANPDVKEKFLKTNFERRGRYYGNQQHILNYDNYNKDFVLKNFTTNGIVTLEQRADFVDYFGFKNPKNGLRKLKQWNIQCEISNNFSFAEKNLLKRLKGDFKNFDFEENNRSLIINPNTGYPLEIDIIVKLNEDIICGVEYNGSHWHNKANPVKEELKSKLCEEKNIRLFHIWSDSFKEDYLELSKFLSLF